MRPVPLLIGMILSVLVLPTACTRQNTGGGTPETVVALVNGAPVTEDDIAMAVDVHGRRQSPEARQEALRELIDRELLYQEGLKLGLDSDAKYRDMVRMMELRLREATHTEMARRVMSTRIASSVNITDADTRRYFDENKARITTEVRLQILNLPDVQAGQAALQLVKAGQPIEKAAPEQPGRMQGAAALRDTGFLRWNQVPTEWTDAVDALSPGAVSDVLSSTKTGICIVKLVERRTITDATYERMSAGIMNRLRDLRVEEAYERHVADLRSRAKIVIKDERRKAS